jgi:signal recognition particle GTPase
LERTARKHDEHVRLLPTVTIMELTDRGSLSKITSMIPGMSGMMEEGGEEEASAKLKRMIFITDAMRADELDSDGLIFVSFKIHDLEPS